MFPVIMDYKQYIRKKSVIAHVDHDMPGPVVEETEAEMKLKNDRPIIEDVKEEDDHDLDDDADDCYDDDDYVVVGGTDSFKQSRSEKKIRKAMLNLGLKPVTDVSRVTINRTVVKSFRKPDVFKIPHSETYVIFGDAKLENLSFQLKTQDAQQFRMPDIEVQADEEEEEEIDKSTDEEEEEDIDESTDEEEEEDIDESTNEVEEEDIDESGVDASDIYIVMAQAGVSKSEAVRALKTNSGDIVSAIMELFI